ncbi:hypothetical protein NKJ09_24870 [Mesorhizobium sp. M0189]|uniref:hypothetical protein n=1 Tax=unclassified Mesorhizobium TaxID=325217 RepID=UPI00333857ED
MEAVGRFNRLSFEQWSLLIAMTASAILFRQAPNLRTDPAYLLDERIGGMVGAFVAGLLIPYGLAWLFGRLMRRNRIVFLTVLWVLALLMFVVNLKLRYECPTCY